MCAKTSQHISVKGLIEVRTTNWILFCRCNVLTSIWYVSLEKAVRTWECWLEWGICRMMLSRWGWSWCWISSAAFPTRRWKWRCPRGPIRPRRSTARPAKESQRRTKSSRYPPNWLHSSPYLLFFRQFFSHDVDLQKMERKITYIVCIAMQRTLATGTQYIIQVARKASFLLFPSLLMFYRILNDVIQEGEILRQLLSLFVAFFFSLDISSLLSLLSRHFQDAFFLYGEQST